MGSVTEKRDHRTPFYEIWDRTSPSFARLPSKILALRRRGIETFQKLGFPTTRHEDWKYTSVLPILETQYGTAVADDQNVTAVISHHTFGKDWSALIVFVNGVFSPALSFVGALPEGVRVMTMQEALKSAPELVESRLGKTADVDSNGFVALNTALFDPGIVVHVGRGVALEKPIHVLYVGHVTHEPIVLFPRNLCVLEEGAQATFVENYSDIGEHVYFENCVTEITVADGAVCEHYKLGRQSDNAFHVSWTNVTQGRASNYTSHVIATGGALSRYDLNVVQAGEGASTTMNGLYLAQGDQHVDHHTLMDHAKPNGTSVEHYRGILDGRSRGVFNGKIMVRPGASKTNAAQSNHNILLTEDALIDTKPQLEILNDDVKCAHGATVGQLDQAALFYVRSRGLNERAARNLLTFAFASDVVNHLKIDALRTRLADYLAHRFSRDLNLENAS